MRRGGILWQKTQRQQETVTPAGKLQIDISTCIFFHSIINSRISRTKNYKHNCTNKIMWHFATLLLVKLVPFFNLHSIENKHFMFVCRLLFFWKNMYLCFTPIIKLHSLVLSLYLFFTDVYLNTYHLS